MIQFTSQKVLVIQLSLSALIEEMETTSKNPRIPFNPETRKDMREILSAAWSAHSKLVSVTGNDVRVDPYREGDENEFFTKES